MSKMYSLGMPETSAPASVAASAPALAPAPAPAPATPSTSATSALPDGYLDSGYVVKPEPDSTYKPYPRAEYLGEYAEEIAAGLAGKMKRIDFSRMVKSLRKYENKRYYPFEARRSALMMLRPQAVLMVQNGNAPKLLVDLIESSLSHVTDDDDWCAMVDHLKAIVSYMAVQEAQIHDER